MVEEADRQAHDVAEHPLAQALDRTHRQAGEPGELDVAQHAGETAREQGAEQQRRDRQRLGMARQQHVVDEDAREDRPGRLEQRGADQPGHGAEEYPRIRPRGLDEQPHGRPHLATQRARRRLACGRLPHGRTLFGRGAHGERRCIGAASSGAGACRPGMDAASSSRLACSCW